MNSRCPSLDQLKDFAFGRLSNELMNACGDHIDDCQECLAVLHQEQRSPDGVCDALKRLVRQRDQTQGVETEVTPSAVPQFAEGSCPLKPGSTFGRFEIIEQIGQGSFGVVFRARDTRLSREVAIKIPWVRARWSSEDLPYFQHEAMIAAQLSHPNILPIYDVGEIEGIAFIASEYCQGPSLEQWLRSGGMRVESRAASRPKASAQIAAALARAVEYAHRCGVLHRDIKPSNIMLQPVAGASPLTSCHGLGYTPKLADFGLAGGLKDYAAQQSTRSTESHPVGTPRYMAPEVQLLGGQAATSASDVYSLGVLLYVLLTDQQPFPSLRFIDALNQPQAAALVWSDSPRIPKDLRAIATKCLNKSPANRYRDAGILADDLDRFLQDQPVSARQRNRTEAVWDWLRKHPSFALLVAMVLVSLGAWSLNLQSQRRQLQKVLSRAERGEQDARAHADAAFLRLASNAIEAREFEVARQYLDRALRLNDPMSQVEAVPSFENRYLRGLLPQPKSIAVIDAHPGGITSIVSMNEIQALASAGRDGAIAVWKTPSLESAHRWVAHEGDINRLIRHDTGECIASCGDDGYVRVWDARTGVLKREHPFGKRLFELAFCQQGRILLIGGDLDNIIAWDWDRDVEVFRIPSNRVRAMAVDPLGERVAYADMTTGLSLATLDSDRVESSVLLASDLRLNDIKFSRDGRYLLGANRDRRIALWDTDRQVKIVDWKGHIDAVHALDFVGDGERIVSTSNDRTLAIWERSGELVSRFRAGDEVIWSLDHSNDGAWIATGDKSGKLKLWDFQTILPGTSAIEHAVEGSTAGNFAAWISPSMVATTSKSAAFSICSLPTFRDCKEIGQATAMRDLHDLAVDGSGTIILGANLRGDMAAWSIPDGQQLFYRSGNAGQLFAVEFLKGTSQFITATESGNIAIHSFNDGQSSSTLWSHHDLALCLALTPNEKRLASAGEDRQIIIGAIDGNSDPVRQENVALDRIEHASIPSALTFLDDRHLLIGDRDGRILQWDLDSKQFTKNYSGAEDRILVLKSSPDRKTLVAGCRDGRILCWSIATGQLTLELQAREDASVRDLFFHPNGDWLLASIAYRDGRGTVRCFHSPRVVQ